jgi:glycerol-3-phosphate acyltransferase PlsY
MNIYKVVIFLIAYFICSINPAIIICKLKTGEDIRRLGSGNAGTANTMRVLGKPLGILVTILDIAKVFLTLYIINKVTNIWGKQITESLKNIIILGVIFGHCFPIYHGFRGGKGVIVGITLISVLDPKTALICIISAAIVMLFTRTVSVGTLAGVILYIIIAIVMQYEYLFSVIIAASVIIFKHRQSIQRILTKQEGKF